MQDSFAWLMMPSKTIPHTTPGRTGKCEEKEVLQEKVGSMEKSMIRH
jgi:hypothetical protein